VSDRLNTKPVAHAPGYYFKSRSREHIHAIIRYNPIFMYFQKDRSWGIAIIGDESLLDY